MNSKALFGGYRTGVSELEDGNLDRILTWYEQSEVLGKILCLGAIDIPVHGVCEYANGFVVRVSPDVKPPSANLPGGYGMLLELNDMHTMFVQPGQMFSTSVQFLHPDQVVLDGNWVHPTVGNILPELYGLLDKSEVVEELDVLAVPYALDEELVEGWKVTQCKWSIVLEKGNQRIILGHSFCEVLLVESMIHHCMKLLEVRAEHCTFVECRFDIMSPLRQSLGFDTLLIELT
jgi:hypothetical protein